MKRIQNVPGAPQAVGPYSIYTEANGFMFLSGQIGLDPLTGKLKEGVQEQTKQLLKNVETILESRELIFSNICKSTIFLTNMADFTLVNQIYGEKFEDAKPARSTVAVSALPLGALVEMEFLVAVP
jgi:2-iminobutanoate/2-iminopropanoate deaminase